MRRRLIHLVFFVVVLGLARSASALVVSGFQEWSQRTQLADLGGLEITSTGYAKFTARVDHDVTDVIIHPGGILETLDTYKLPDNRHSEPERSNAYVYGTWNARDIQSFGVERAAYIYIGPKGEINITSNTDSGASYNPQAWLDEAQLGGRSLLLAPELDPAVWSIQIEDLGGGAYRITAVGPPPGGAAMPTPEDGATDVARDVVLGWTPGPFAPAVNGHLVYLSESFSDVNDGMGGITQSASSYAPLERLAFETTYYWRVDEVNAPPDSTVFPGDVWSFTTEPVGYPIEGVNITATASSAGQANFGPENTINGSGLDENDLHSISTTDMWLSGNELQGAWIQYEFDNVYKLHQMWVWNSNQQLEPFLGFGLKEVSVEYSINGIDWTALADVPEFTRAPGEPGYAHDTTVDFGGAPAKFVKLMATSNWGGMLPQYGLSEVGFFSIPVSAREPSPDDDAVDVNPAVALSWRAGREAGTHDVYVSTDEQAVIDGTAPAVSVTDAGYGADLNLAYTYYWRIDEVNDAETPETWQGDVWSFSTSEYLVVDDFELYNDIDPPNPESNRIFESWIDGYDVATNGALIGYDPPQPSYLETTIVHGDRQSLPVFYSNTGRAVSSETTHTFTPGQDWTKHGIQTLVLYFHGTPGNTGQLYLKVNGVKLPYPGDATDIANPRWAQWNIDLASLGVTLTNVATLAIGLDGNGAAGTLYVDDIRLYRMAPELAEVVYIEAEAATLGARWRVYNDPTSSGGSHIGSEDGDGNDGDAAPGVEWVATYNFTVSGGTYTVILRAQDAGDDSFWVRMPSATSQTHEDPDQPGTGWVLNDIGSPEGVWEWETVESDDHNDAVVTWTLPAGANTIEIAKREDGVWLDAILISKAD